ncbi:MAG: glycosyltransferase, partial [bacterium]|nr:glycosyltransferase [bacterium]
NKKLLLISVSPFPYGDASANTMITYMKGFNENGGDSELVCLFPNLKPIYSIEPKGVYEGVHYSYLLNKVHFSFNKIKRYFELHFIPIFKYWSLIKKLSKKYDLTVIFFAHINRSFYNLSAICHYYKANVVFTACEFPEYIKVIDDNNRSLRFRKYCKFIDQYVFETKTLENYYIKVLNNQIDSIVIPAPMLFEDIITTMKTSTHSYIAYCGSIHSDEKDGLSSILYAFSDFHKHDPHVKMFFVGRVSNYKYQLQLLEIVNKNNLQDYVIFTGEVSRPEYVNYLVNATLLVVAKGVDSYYSGGLSSKVVEYLFSGNPVLMVASDDFTNYLTHLKNVFFI